MISVLGSTNVQLSWVCRYNSLRKAKPGIYAIDARQEVTMVGDERYAEDNEYQSEEEADYTQRSETTRNEKEAVAMKREHIMNR